MVCALAVANIPKALDIHHEMSDVNKKHPSTQYLLYKVALRSQNTDLGRQSPSRDAHNTDAWFDSCSVP